MAVGLLCGSDPLVWMFHKPPPLPIVHEAARLRLARWKLRRIQLSEGLAGEPLLSGVVPLLTDAIEIQAEGVGRRSLGTSHHASVRRATPLGC